MLPSDLPQEFERLAEMVAEFSADQGAAKAYRKAAELTRKAIEDYENEELPLDAAAAESDYSVSQLRRLFPERKSIPRRALPRKARPIARTPVREISSPMQMAREILARG